MIVCVCMCLCMHVRVIVCVSGLFRGVKKCAGFLRSPAHGLEKCAGFPHTV